MSILAVALAAAALTAQAPLALDVAREGESVTIAIRLVEELPEAFERALPSGAVVRVVYPLRVRARRKLWWDRRLWKGRVVATTSFDPLTGRYRCSLFLDEVFVAGREAESSEAARSWLIAPPVIRIAIPASRHERDIRVRTRAVFATTTTWLVFPSAIATDWVEVALSPAADSS